MSNDIPSPPMQNPPPPMSPPPMMGARPASMFQTWIDALTKPNERTFAAMASRSDAKASTGFLWVFIGSLIQSFIAFLVQGAVFRQMLEQQGLADQVTTGLGSTVAQLVCGAPIAAVVTVVFFAIGTALIQWIARMFGGRGTFEQLAYVFGAIAAPASVVSALFLLLGAIPYVGVCFRVIAGLVGIYVLVLEIMAVKGVNGFGWGQAAGSVLIPVLAIFLVCCCATIGLLSLIGASVGNIFSSMGPFPIPTP